MSRPDVLLLSLGTTPGLRVADSAFLEQARGAGASVAAARVRLGAFSGLSRSYALNDLLEAGAARRAVRAALAHHEPRTVVFSTVTASLLAPRLELPYAVRFDSPAALNRPGPRNALGRRLERLALAHARVLLPWSATALAALHSPPARAVILPPPIVPSGSPLPEPEPLAVAYVPRHKGEDLGLLCASWTQASIPGARLAVFGLKRERALARLQRSGASLPPGLELKGAVARNEFRSTLRRCRAFVSAARWEDFGQAQLEALADGALLVTAPAGGAYEAQPLARALAPQLVAPAVSPGALASSLRAAFAMGRDEIATYRAAAAERLLAYRPERLERTISEQVLPELLGS